MVKSKFGYLNKLMDGSTTTRERSKKQESRIAKKLRGYTTINSGATFGQNDVITDFCEIEAKTTAHESYSLKLSEWVKLKKKCSAKKIPTFVVDFEKSRDSLAILTYEDLQFLIELAYKDNS